MSVVPLLEMRGIGKRFPGVVALEGVDLELGTGEVLALIGENGAGKSTLMKILGGVYPPDSGTICMEGREVHVRGVKEATRLGIGFIHQELNVLDNLDVAGNVFLGREPTRGPVHWIDRRRMDADTRPLLARLGLEVTPRTPLADLSIAQRQLVEIAKALSLEARVLIMDEPTSSLTLSETQRLLTLVRELREQGVSIIYISHRLSEITECADRVVALRDGRRVGDLDRTEITHDRMVRLMVGRDIQNFYVPPEAPGTTAALRVRQLHSRAYPDCAVSFDAARGEILGLAGLVGAGRSEMAQALFGIDGPRDAEITLHGEPVTIRHTRDAIRAGIYLIPEDRRGAGLITEMTVRENITLPDLPRYAPGGLIRRPRETAVASTQCERLQVRTPGVEARVVHLSGGNQQKVVLAKWLSMAPRVLIFDEPTRGIDVGAKAEIYRLMRDLAREGAVILMISSDMEEVINVSDRVAVMHEGRLSGVLARDACSEEHIMQLAVGGLVPAAGAACFEEHP